MKEGALFRRREFFGEAGAAGIRCDMARAEPTIDSLGQDQTQCLRGNGGVTERY